MVHELLGLNDNRVVLKGAPGVRKDLEEVKREPCSDVPRNIMIRHNLSRHGSRDYLALGWW